MTPEEFLKKQLTSMCHAEGLPQSKTDFIVGDALSRYKHQKFPVRESSKKKPEEGGKVYNMSSNAGVIANYVKKKIAYEKKLIQKRDLEEQKRAHQSFESLTHDDY